MFVEFISVSTCVKCILDVLSVYRNAKQISFPARSILGAVEIQAHYSSAKQRQAQKKGLKIAKKLRKVTVFLCVCLQNYAMEWLPYTVPPTKKKYCRLQTFDCFLHFIFMVSYFITCYFTHFNWFHHIKSHTLHVPDLEPRTITVQDEYSTNSIQYASESEPTASVLMIIRWKRRFGH